MKQHIKEKYKFELEMVPPGCHQCIPAKVAIRNFKAHFLSVLAGTADSFPLHLWDKLLPQAEITINLLRQSNATPTVSAYAHLNGPFDYNKMPLAPMGCNVQVHEKSDARGTWAFHSVDGWYLGTSPKHYRTHKCHIKATNSDRFSDTVEFQHKRITNPAVKPEDKIMKAISACIDTLRGLPAFNSNHDMQQLHTVLQDATEHPAQLRKLVQQSKKQQQQPLPRVAIIPQTTPVAADDQRVTRALAKQLSTAVHPVSRTPPQIPSRKKRRRVPTPTPTPAHTTPAMNTRAKTAAKAEY